jgi:hypothetical protein
MAPDIECVRYHQWMVGDWTQHEVIRVAPVPGMAVYCQWRVRDRMSIELLVWGLGMRMELEGWLLLLNVCIIIGCITR